MTIEYRWAEGCDRLPLYAADLVRRQVIVANRRRSTVTGRKAATATVPSVFGLRSGDPIGLVASLNRSGGTDASTFLAVQQRGEWG